MIIMLMLNKEIFNNIWNHRNTIHEIWEIKKVLEENWIISSNNRYLANIINVKLILQKQ